MEYTRSNVIKKNPYYVTLVMNGVGIRYAERGGFEPPIEC
jgi:hypothetical protein